MQSLLILKNRKIKGFAMTMQCYFKRQSSIHYKSHHILVKGLPDNIISPARSKKYSLDYKKAIFQCCFLGGFLAATWRLFFVKAPGQFSKSTKWVPTKSHLGTSKRSSWLGFMTHSTDLCMSETVSSFGKISNPSTVRSISSFSEKEDSLFGKTEKTRCCWKKCPWKNLKT